MSTHCEVYIPTGNSHLNVCTKLPYLLYNQLWVCGCNNIPSKVVKCEAQSPLSPSLSPSAGESTNFGLKAEVEARWKRQQELEAHGDYCTTYAQSFKYVAIL